MLLQAIREELVEYGRRMLEQGLTRGSGGYLSVYDRKENLIAITPSGLGYRDTRPENIILATPEGVQVDGIGKVSTEWHVQQQIYLARPDVSAVVHTHSLYAIVMSTTRKDVPVANFTMSRAGGPVRCAGYYNYTSQELADDVLDKLKDRYAVLMGNHGLVACGANLKEAFELAEEVEYGCEVYWRAACIGTPVCLTDAQVADQIEEGRRYAKTQSEWEK